VSSSGAASARDPTAPSALADPGLVLVRGPDRPDLWDERKGWIMSVKLTDAQLVMKSAAARRKDRCLSVPATIKGAALSKVSEKLVKLGLACVIEAKPGAPIWRRDEAGQGYALKLTAAGLKAIAVDEGPQDAIEPSKAPQPQVKDGASPDEGGLPGRRCQSKFYTACLRLRAGQSSAVFAHESPTRSGGFGVENGLYLFALTVPTEALPGLNEDRGLAAHPLVAADSHVDVKRIELDATTGSAGLVGRDESRA
jgi:hypothetical protein